MTTANYQQNYVLLGICQAHAPTNTEQAQLSTMFNKAYADAGADHARVQLMLVGVLHDGLMHGNWPWIEYAVDAAVARADKADASTDKPETALVNLRRALDAGDLSLAHDIMSDMEGDLNSVSIYPDSIGQPIYEGDARTAHRDLVTGEYEAVGGPDKKSCTVVVEHGGTSYVRY